MIKYEDGVNGRFNGDVSEFNYSIYNSVTSQIAYKYDDLDRLTDASGGLPIGLPNDNGVFGYTYYPNNTLNRVLKKSV